MLKRVSDRDGYFPGEYFKLTQKDRIKVKRDIVLYGSAYIKIEGDKCFYENILKVKLGGILNVESRRKKSKQIN